MQLGTHESAGAGGLCMQIVCGNRAGAATILIDELGEHPKLSGEETPTHVARSMHEVAELLRQHFNLAAAEGEERKAPQEAAGAQIAS